MTFTTPIAHVEKLDGLVTRHNSTRANIIRALFKRGWITVQPGYAQPPQIPASDKTKPLTIHVTMDEFNMIQGFADVHFPGRTGKSRALKRLIEVA
jgi:hypothetical protein